MSPNHPTGSVSYLSRSSSSPLLLYIIISIGIIIIIITTSHPTSCTIITTSNNGLKFTKPLKSHNFYLNIDYNNFPNSLSSAVDLKKTLRQLHDDEISLESSFADAMPAPSVKLLINETFPLVTIPTCDGDNNVALLYNNTCWYFDIMTSSYANTESMNKTRLEASVFCNGLPSTTAKPWHIGMIHSAEEEAFVRAVMRYLLVKEYILGYEKVSGTWGATDLPFTAWKTVPNDGDSCIIATRDGWESVSDSAAANFFCVREP